MTLKSDKTRQAYLIKNRIFDDTGFLYGFVVKKSGKLSCITSEQTLNEFAIKNRQFIVDIPGADIPALLDVVHYRTKTGLAYYFRTIKDKTEQGKPNVRNNLKKVPILQKATALKRFARFR